MFCAVFFLSNFFGDGVKFFDGISVNVLIVWLICKREVFFSLELLQCTFLNVSDCVLDSSKVVIDLFLKFA
jgi:hypothetical protein